jgi:hypothetical protein
MNTYGNPNDRAHLAVDHDAHGCAILSISPADRTKPYTYGIPKEQIVAVLLDIAGGPETEEETEDALNYLGEPENAAKGMEDLLTEARVALITLRIRHAAMSVVDAQIVEDDEDPEAANDAETLHKELGAAYEENEQLREVINTIGAGLAGILEALGRVK